MIPPASTPSSTPLITTMPATKAKIGFSIDSIVGEDVTRSPIHKDIKAELKYANDYQNEIDRALRIQSIATAEQNHDAAERFKPGTDPTGDNRLPAGYLKYIHQNTPLNRHPLPTHNNPYPPPHHLLHPLIPHHHNPHHMPPEHLRDSSVSPPPAKHHRSSDEPPSLRRSPSHSPPPNAISRRSPALRSSSPSRSPPPSSQHPPRPSSTEPNHPGASSQYTTNGPHPAHQLPPPLPGGGGGPIRPMPMVPQGLGGGPDATKSLPPYLNLPGLGQAAHHNPHMMQFNMLLAQRHAADQMFQGGPKFGQPHPGMPPNLMNGREGYPLYPWLLSRHGRIFPHGFPGNFLLHPFRKPKRVRTAFSPSQLLKLEHAFESNQYVVGAERKALAQALNLSETQVKVWFQNRRTKHKRMQQEDESKGSGGNNNNGSMNASNSSSSSQNPYEDELIDMDDSYSEDDSDSPQ